MGTFTAGEVVLVQFPFSDLSAIKLRPVVILAEISNNDYLLCQITSKTYSDPFSTELNNIDFVKGSLQRVSYVRPGKLFTANERIINGSVGLLKRETLEKTINCIIHILKSGLNSY